jgi:hypothetical protein
MPTHEDLSAIKILENSMLAPGTILVSSDVARVMREEYSEEGKDREFLREVGIEDAVKEIRKLLAKVRKE